MTELLVHESAFADPVGVDFVTAPLALSNLTVAGPDLALEVPASSAALAEAGSSAASEATRANVGRLTITTNYDNTPPTRKFRLVSQLFRGVPSAAPPVHSRKHENRPNAGHSGG